MYQYHAVVERNMSDLHFVNVVDIRKDVFAPSRWLTIESSRLGENRSPAAETAAVIKVRLHF